MLINMLRPSRAISSCSCYMPGFVAQAPQPSNASADGPTTHRRWVPTARSTASNVCCLLTKIEAAQHPAIARHTVRIAFATVAAPHQRHAIASAFATHNKHSEHSLARQQHKPSPRNIQNGRPDSQTTGDFTNKQFSEQEVANKVIEQYSEAARTFYKYVMGGGGYDIHYGMFRTVYGVFESSKNTNAALLRLLDQTRPVTRTP